MNTAYITESNKIASPYAWIWLLEITTAGYGTPLRFTNNNDDVVWPTVGGNTYSKMPFTVDDIQVSTSGEFPEYKLVIGDVNLSGALRTRVGASGGLVGSVVRFMVAHSNHLDLTTSAIDEYADVLSCELTAQAVVFTIGIPNLLSRRFPRDRYVPGYCRHRFEGALCQYEQPDYSVVSNNVVFSSPAYAEGHPVDQITVSGVDLITSVFRYTLPLGEVEGTGWALSKDTGFTISGSLYNDGFFLADNWYAVYSTHVYVKREAESGKVFTPETVLTGVTIQLGYNACDHTLNACKFRDNMQNYGGSPGIIGGIYG